MRKERGLFTQAGAWKRALKGCHTQFSLQCFLK